VEPISILRAEDNASPVFHLAFDAQPQPDSPEVARRENATDSDPSSDDQAEETDGIELVESTRSGGSVGKILTEINTRLEAIAESGIQTGLAAHREWFASAQSDAFALGFTPLARVLESLSKPTVSPGAIVKARYLTHLYSQATEHPAL
jgi:hypothetical protein